MRRGTLTLLLFIILLAACAAYIDWPNNPGINIGFLGYSNPLKVKEGLDLQGGVSVLLVPKNPQNYDSSALAENVAAARDQIEQRVNGGLGVNEPDIRVETINGIPSIAVELPGLNSGDPFAAVNSLLQTGTLEFWSTGPTQLQIGSTFDPSQYTAYNPGGQPQFTGKDLDANNIYVGQDTTGQPDINFEMKGDAVGKFYTFTQKNQYQYLTVTLDREVIESAVIQSAINGPGQITGRFTQQQAQQIVTLLKYGRYLFRSHLKVSRSLDQHWARTLSTKARSQPPSAWASSSSSCCSTTACRDCWPTVRCCSMPVQPLQSSNWWA